MNHLGQTRPKIFKLLQTLLDSTPLPRDILEYIIVPDLLPSQNIARAKMASVMRSLIKLKQCLCTYCGYKSVSVATTDKQSKYQPFSQKETSSYIPFCVDCKKHHLRKLAKWNNCKKRKKENHPFQQYNPNRPRGIYDELQQFINNVHAGYIALPAGMVANPFGPL